MSENGVKTIKDFAAEIGVHRQAVGIVVANHNLPTVSMAYHGMAKGLPPKTQRAVKRILGIKSTKARATA